MNTSIPILSGGAGITTLQVIPHTPTTLFLQLLIAGVSVIPALVQLYIHRQKNKHK